MMVMVLDLDMELHMVPKNRGKPTRVLVEKGAYPVRQIPNPISRGMAPWLVTRENVGAGEEWLRRRRNVKIIDLNDAPGG